MSKVELNALVNGLSGRIGNAVFVRRGNRTLLSSRPKKRTSEPTEKEKAQRDLFRRAAAYAKARMSDAASKAEYAAIAANKESLSAFTAAVTDFLKAPVIDAAKTDAYTGKINDVISAKVSDGFKIISVKATITLPTGVILETGAATFNAVALEWKYIATQANNTLAGTKIKFTATDRPGNETSIEKVI